MTIKEKIMTGDLTKEEKIAMSETKKDIIRRTLPIFLERGVKTSMDEISQLLSVSKRTIYENFENKDDLIFQCMITMVEEESEEMDAYIQNCRNPIEELFPLLHKDVKSVYGLRFRFLDDVKRIYPNVHRQYASIHREKHTKRLHDIIKRGKQQDLFRNEINEDIVLYFMPKIASVLSDQKIDMCGIYSMKDVFINLVVPFMRGILTPKGTIIYDEVIERYKKYTPNLTDNN